MKYTFSRHKRHFIIAFTLIVTALAIVKRISPELPGGKNGTKNETFTPVPERPDSILVHARAVDSLLLRERRRPVLLKPDGTPVRNRVTSVRGFDECFPDLNDVQLATASRLGIAHMENREEAQRRKEEVVYVGDNPYYHVQPLHQSIPYLIPRAATLLNEIARAFNDSLATKGYTPHKLIVTSVLRTREDVQRLRRFNKNASENSCHQHATTFDISYNRFLEIKPDGESGVRWVTAFKSILAEVLEDQREAGTCYVKYEMKQSCFHVTAR